MPETEKMPLEILIDYAKKTNREAKYGVKAYPSNLMHRQVDHMRKLYFPIDSTKRTWLVAFSDMRSMSHEGIFNGVCFETNIPLSSHIKVREKNILDKLSFKKAERKLGCSDFDSKFVISGNDSSVLKTILGNHRAQDLVKRALKLHPQLLFYINGHNLDFVPELEGKSFVGIFMYRTWLLDEKILEQLFEIVEELRRVTNET